MRVLMANHEYEFFIDSDLLRVSFVCLSFNIKF